MEADQYHTEESKRLSDLASYSILDSLPELEYDHIVELASMICGTKYAYVSFIDEETQWIKAAYGFEPTSTPRVESFCTNTIDNPSEILIIDDARNDPRFKDLYHVRNSPNIVFYTGIPLVSKKGYALGTLCVLDDEKKQLSGRQMKSLVFLKDQILKLLELRLKEKALNTTLEQLKIANTELDQFNLILKDYKHAIDVSSIVAITDPNGNITYVNQKFCDIAEYSQEELLGQNQRIVNSGYHTSYFWKEFWKTISSGNVWSGEIRNRSKSGKIYWVETTVVPFLDPNTHKPFQYLSIRKDITEHKLMMDKLLSSIIFSQEEEREFLSHDIHEGLAQFMTALRFKIELLSDTVEDKNTAFALKDIHQQLEGSVEEIRLLALNLMPRTIMEFGLIPSLQHYFESINKKWNNKIIVNYSSFNYTNLPKSTIISIYRTITTLIEEAMRKVNMEPLLVTFIEIENFHCELTINGITNKSYSKEQMVKINEKFYRLKKRLEINGGTMFTKINYDRNETKVVILFE